MDTVKQAFAAILGSIALSGCLTDPNIVDVPVVAQEQAGENADGTDATALLPGPRLPADLLHDRDRALPPSGPAVWSHLAGVAVLASAERGSTDRCTGSYPSPGGTTVGPVAPT